MVMRGFRNIFLRCGALAACLCLASAGTFLAQNGTGPTLPQPVPAPQIHPIPDVSNPDIPPISRKQKDAILKQNYKKMKQDAAQLVKLANQLQKSVDNSNSEILSVDVVKKADQIEKLAKKIKGKARGY
jgi:hypothetical protein